MMHGEPKRIGGWRSAFAAWAKTAPAVGQCPTAEQLWEARECELPEAQRLAVIDHVGVCGSCAADWRLGLNSVGETGASYTIAVAEPGPARWRPSLAAAAVLTLGVALLLTQIGGAPGTIGADAPYAAEYRSTDAGQNQVVSNVDGVALPRNSFVLQWTPVSGAVHYSVRVATLDLEQLYIADNLADVALTVPAQALAGVGDGDVVTWQVTAQLSDGSSVRSQSFVALLD